ncbi:hypothetical protein HAU46_10415 [Weissella confusa]|uniref:hypothetical protein n=1 Tax=Weissella confusa TaxID=1583 RepID=UPI0018F26D6E|nr:hypothetical protein [Weissella confusa]MBJ7648375.1 hypothetical protein [Weissella confusa]MBJ7680895.1 hypothetical protein [Weissella confusa]
MDTEIQELEKNLQSFTKLIASSDDVLRQMKQLDDEIKVNANTADLRAKDLNNQITEYANAVAEMRNETTKKLNEAIEKQSETHQDFVTKTRDDLERVSAKLDGVSDSLTDALKVELDDAAGRQYEAIQKQTQMQEGLVKKTSEDLDRVSTKIVDVTGTLKNDLTTRLDAVSQSQQQGIRELNDMQKTLNENLVNDIKEKLEATSVSQQEAIQTLVEKQASNQAALEALNQDTLREMKKITDRIDVLEQQSVATQNQSEQGAKFAKLALGLLAVVVVLQVIGILM